MVKTWTVIRIGEKILIFYTIIDKNSNNTFKEILRKYKLLHRFIQDANSKQKKSNAVETAQALSFLDCASEAGVNAHV